MTEFIWATALGLGKLMALVFFIVVPLMVLLEFSRQYGILGKALAVVRPFGAVLGFREQALIPLLAGIIFGISYGAGVLLAEARAKRILGRQSFLVAVFLGLCHAVIEDTLLFVSYGGVWWIMLGTRLVLACVVTAIASMLTKHQEDALNR